MYKPKLLHLLVLTLLINCISCKDPYSEIVNSETDYRVVPKPVQLTPSAGRFVFDEPVGIVADSEVFREAEYLKELLSGISPDSKTEIQSTADVNDKKIMLLLDTLSLKGEGAYDLRVGTDAVTIKANTAKGVFYGIQSLRQLIDGAGVVKDLNFVSIPSVSMQDNPRFSYRGMHLDVARHFQPVSFVKRYIDMLALHKMNTFHWHLTEDQGWRIEIKKYPDLTRVGAWRNGTVVGKLPWTENDNEVYGGYYTQEEIREVVQYAAERHIAVIPEIELPGHSSAAIAAYPELSCFPDRPTTPKRGGLSAKSREQQQSGNPKIVYEEWGVTDDVYCAGKETTFTFIEDVLEEVVALFPSTYIHIGGDECPKGHWEKCDNCQKRIEEEGLADEHELQSYFISRVEKYLNKKGKQIIGWDEILEGGLAPNATVMYWRSWDDHKSVISAASEGHEVIMTPNSPMYFDHYQADPDHEPEAICCLSPVQKVYEYEPVPAELQKMGKEDLIIGAQANVWTEYMKDSAYIEYMVLPRMAALSEVVWSSKDTKEYKDFLFRLEGMKEVYDQEGYTYAPHVFEKEEESL